MAKRTSKTEQAEHDLVIEESARTYRDKEGIAYTNPGTEKNNEIDGLYPDVVAREKNGLLVIEEIETENTVTEDECQRQWKPYSKLSYLFRLVVPKGKLNVAQSIINRSNLSLTLQAYTISGSRVIFYDSQGNRM